MVHGICDPVHLWYGVDAIWYSDLTKYELMNYKDTKPYMSAFLKIDLLTDFAAFF
jgi:hypothetical protein